MLRHLSHIHKNSASNLPDLRHYVVFISSIRLHECEAGVIEINYTPFESFKVV